LLALHWLVQGEEFLAEEKKKTGVPSARLLPGGSFMHVLQRHLAQSGNLSCDTFPRPRPRLNDTRTLRRRHHTFFRLSHTHNPILGAKLLL
jgi:hypothetical protein